MAQSVTAARQARILGTLRIDAAGRAVEIAHAGPRCLLALLLLAPDLPQTRESLIDRLWPEAAPAAGRRALSDAIYRLRRALGPGWLHADRRSVGLADPASLWIDARSFAELASGDGPEALRAAVGLYAGDLLPEIYADWAAGPRAALRERFLSTLERLGEAAEGAGRLDEALACFQRLVHDDPLREEGHRGLMRTLARAGRHHEALERYEQLAAALRAEFGAEPVAATRDLAARLRAEAESARAAGPEPLFVGRAAERRLLLRCLDRAGDGRGGLAVVLGEAGIGKSRLLAEVARSAAWRRWQVAAGKCEDFTHPPAYAPLPEALGAALPRPRLQQLAQLVPPFWLATLAALVPQAAALAPGAAPEPQDEGQLAAALRHTLAGLARIGPHLLLLDDVQWAGQSLWPLLDRLRPALGELGVLLLVAGRDDELRSQPAAQTIAAWEREGVPVLRLAGLSPGELAALAAARGGEAIGAAALDRLAAASGGNPLIALALLQAEPAGRPAPGQLLDELLGRRLGALDPPAREALAAAAVIGYRFDYALWQALCARRGLAETALPEQAGALERAGLLILEQAGYRFAHDTLRAYVYRRQTADARRRLHADALEVCAQHAPEAGLALLFHATQSGQIERAGRYAVGAGEQALRGGAPRQAAEHFAFALDALPAADLAGRLAAARGSAQALDRLSDRAAQAAAVALLQQIADALGEPAAQAEAAWQRASLEWTTGNFAAARAHALAGLAHAAERRPTALLLEIAGRAERDLGDYAAAEASLRAAQSHYLALDDEAGAAWIDGQLGLVAQRRGRFAEAAAFQQRAVAAHRAGGDPYAEMRAAIGLAIAHWMLGDYLAARAVFERTLQISRQCDDRRIEEASLANLGAIADILGDYRAALALKEQALARSRAADNRMGVALGLCNIGITAYKLGRLAESLAAFDEALAIDRATGRRQGEAYCLSGRGVTLAALGRHAEARESLEAARAIRAGLAERDTLVATEAELALVALADNDPAAARSSLDVALAGLQPSDRADLRELVYYAAFCVLAVHGEQPRAVSYLGRAVAAMEELAAALPPEARERLLRDDPLNRRVRAAAASLARTVELRLARADSPLGRALAADDYVLVRWSIELPGDSLLPEPTRRRKVLCRLLAEAAEAAAAPTDADLAAALGVSRRTILRDMASLAAAGASLPTRRRR